MKRPEREMKRIEKQRELNLLAMEGVEKKDVLDAEYFNQRNVIGLDPDYNFVAGKKISRGIKKAKLKKKDRLYDLLDNDEEVISGDWEFVPEE